MAQTQLRGFEGGRSPLQCNPQNRLFRFGVLSARKIGLWPIFNEERAGRPWANIFAEVSLPSGVRSAWKTGRWPVFSENGPAGPGKKFIPIGFAAREYQRYERQIRPEGGVGGGRISPPRGLRIHA